MSIIVRCNACNREVVGSHSRVVSCGCQNMTTVKEDTISAKDLSKVIILKNSVSEHEDTALSSADIEWQEQRRRRKVRKLDFEIR